MYVSISKTNLNSYTHSSFTFSPKRFRNSPANKEKEFDLILNDIGTYVYLDVEIKLIKSARKR